MITMYQIAASIVIGVVQGISEWLPISSKTQVLLASTYLLHLSYEQAYSFGLFMEIGTLAGAVIYFRRELWSLIKVLSGSRVKLDRKLFTYVVVVTLITGAIALPVYKKADSLAIPLWIPMLILGIGLLAYALIYWNIRNKITARKFPDMNFKDYILVGIAQGIAVLPGVSRSGITTGTMLVRNIEPDEAFRLSFLVGIFATAGASIVPELLSSSNVGAAISSISVEGLAIAIITAAVISIFFIDFLIKLVKRHNVVYVLAGFGLLAVAASFFLLLFGV